AAAVNLALKHRRGKTPGRNTCHLPVAPQPCTVLRMNKHLIAALLLAAFTLAGAQTAQTTPPSPAAAARPADVDTIDHIIAAVYDVISGPAGQRDWDRFRSLYYPGARMVPTRRDDKGNLSARVATPDEYATRSQDFFTREGFFENSVANRVEQWGNIA